MATPNAAFAVSGQSVDPKTLVRVKCMGTPMIIPEFYANQIPLIQKILNLGMVKPHQKYKCTIHLDCPVSQLSRVYESLVNGDTCNISESDLDRFEILYTKEEYESKFLPEFSMLSIDDVPSTSLEDNCILGTINPQPFFTKSYERYNAVNIVSNISYRYNTLTPESCTLCLAPRAFETKNSCVRIKIPKSCEVIEKFIVRIQFKPLPEGTIWRNDAVEKMIDELSCVIGGQEIMRTNGWTLSIMAQNSNLYTPSYYKKSLKVQQHMSKTGFCVYIPLMIPPINIHGMEYHRMSFHIKLVEAKQLVYSPNGCDCCETELYTINLDMVEKYLSEDQLHLLSGETQQLWISPQSNSYKLTEYDVGSTKSIYLPFNLCGTGLIIIVTPSHDSYGMDPLVDTWHPFRGVNLQVNAYTLLTYSSKFMRHESWALCGMNKPMCRAYWLPFDLSGSPYYGDGTHIGINFSRVAGIELYIDPIQCDNLPGCIPRKWDIQVVFPSYDIGLQRDGMYGMCFSG